MAELSRAAVVERLKVARRDSGLKQSEVADACHVHINTVRNWESAKKPTVPFDHLEKLADLYGVGYKWLLHGDAEPVAPKAEEFSRPLAELAAEMRELRAMLEDLSARLPAPPQRKHA